MLAPTNLYRGQPANTITTLYTVADAPGKYAIIKEIIACNTSSSAVTLTVHTVATGGSGTDANKIFDAVSIAADTTVIFSLSTVLGQNETLRALASSSATITLTVSGVIN